VDKASAFSELGLSEIIESGAVAGVRCRQHVNPLKQQFAAPSPPPAWAEVFEDPTRDMHIDLGCGSGRFLLVLARRHPERNFVGVDIREPLMRRANDWAKELNLPNVHYAVSNATISTRLWMESCPGRLAAVTINNPDPHWKKRHHKRRIVQPQLAEAIVELLPPGGLLMFQSDVLEVAVDMRNHFETASAGRLEKSPLHTEEETAQTVAPFHAEAEAANPGEEARVEEETGHASEWGGFGWNRGWLAGNPFECPTEREVACLAQGKPVYRMLLVKGEQA